MTQIFCLFAVFLFQCAHISSEDKSENNNYITYTLSRGGRFGDQIISYLHAKWFSYVYDLHFIYKPFEGSDQLILHLEEPAYHPPKTFKRKYIYSLLQFSSELKKTVFILRYYPESIYEHRLLLFKDPYFTIDWNVPGFKEKIKQLVAPIGKIKYISIPKDRISIAVHYRGGGDFDSQNTKAYFPLKFPPLQYYIEQLATINSLLDSKLLYVYLFTDEKNPEEISEKMREALHHPENIIFDYRKENATYLDDFFAMTKFDCLIRAQSHFSNAASKISNFLIEIEPIHHTYVKGKGKVIDQVNITFSPDWNEPR